MLGSIMAAVFMAGLAAEDIVLPAQPAPLHGTLLTPDGEASAVAVILPGSGPTDRDGDNPLGVRAATYRLLAEGLAAEGIVSLRIDKRGIGASAGAARSEAELRFNDYVADARAWTSEAVRRTGRPCAWLIGHSEGALVATLAAENNSEICGLVLLSGAGRPAMTVMREQFGAAPEPVRGQALSILDRLERGETVTDVPPALASAFRPSVQPYLASWAVLDPAEALSRYRGPVFIGQGETDLQTRETDAQALKAARPDATLVIWPGVNHVLKTAPADPQANMAAYVAPDLPLGPGVAEDVATFIREHTPAR
ncbi:alpha/beta hydrolase [Brevundimonas sp. PAMC22021]|uniref:alpha/beta hydrolase n=1 Tax=Brevundimonas sp. PAMC22021 TaxID=2861285 RepID=UPI001C632447|nr:alpha/beta fold hydrolase [Brevundimonas sp. PAMC22021]QYF87426.1 lysophospholipase [Brevundimonas sp. PAMC22021]